jgi:hypothetical protein
MISMNGANELGPASLSRRRFITAATLGSVCGGEFGPQQASAQHAEMAVHNMALVGTRSVFLSHLSMFDRLSRTGKAYASPHRYQIILSATFHKKDADASQIYARDREKHQGVGLYTLSPAPFAISTLNLAGAGGRVLPLFRATIFRGHLERRGEPVAELRDVSVQVRQVIHFREFDPEAPRPEALEYILFGLGNELFAAHRIAVPPDFDQILSIKVLGQSTLQPKLLTGATVRVIGRPDTPAKRLKKGERASTVLTGAREQRLQIEVGNEIYFEEGELRIPATFETTEQERRAGF